MVRRWSELNAIPTAMLERHSNVRKGGCPEVKPRGSKRKAARVPRPRWGGESLLILFEVGCPRLDLRVRSLSSRRYRHLGELERSKFTISR